MEFVPTPKVKNVCEAWLHIEDTGNIIVLSCREGDEEIIEVTQDTCIIESSIWRWTQEWLSLLVGTAILSAPSSSPTLVQKDAAGVFDVSSTSGGGADSSNVTRIFRVEGSNLEAYYVVQVNYTLCTA